MVPLEDFEIIAPEYFTDATSFSNPYNNDYTFYYTPNSSEPLYFEHQFSITVIPENTSVEQVTYNFVPRIESASGIIDETGMLIQENSDRCAGTLSVIVSDHFGNTITKTAHINVNYTL